MFANSLPEEPDPDSKPRAAPVFVSKPESIQVEEGEWARFCVRVTGNPRPRVMWLINGHTVVNVSKNQRNDTFSLIFIRIGKIKIELPSVCHVIQGSRFKLTYDGMYHLDIPKTRQYDTGKIEVIARSSVGEALAVAELTVVPRSDDYRGVLKNSPRRKYWFELLSNIFLSEMNSIITKQNKYLMQHDNYI